MKAEKKRLDELIVERGFAPSREKAQGLIRSGLVLVNEQVSDKPGKRIDSSLPLSIKENPFRYVSRGAFKIKDILDHYFEDLTDWTAIDIGASTGGFSQVLLEKGARTVYCVDVGYGQLDWTLRNDPRIINIERYNARYFERGKCIQENDQVHLLVMDVSFISIRKIIPRLLTEIPELKWLFVLVKPQFEVGPKHVKKGIVHDTEVIAQVRDDIRTFGEELGLNYVEDVPSPIKGPKGNQEYVMVFNRK